MQSKPQTQNIYYSTYVLLVLAGSANKVAAECVMSAKLDVLFLYINIIDLLEGDV